MIVQNMSPQIDIVNSSRTRWKFPLARPELLGVLAAMLFAAGKSNTSLELALVDDAGMENLQAEYMGAFGPTNCLSFPASCPKGQAQNGGAPYENLGWLALSTDMVARESFLYGQEPVNHSLRLLAHGLAHLMGHDHSAEMDAFSDALYEAGLKALGVGAGL